MNFITTFDVSQMEISRVGHEAQPKILPWGRKTFMLNFCWERYSTGPLLLIVSRTLGSKRERDEKEEAVAWKIMARVMVLENTDGKNRCLWMWAVLSLRIVWFWQWVIHVHACTGVCICEYTMCELDLKFALSASRQAGCGHSSPFTAQEADREGMLLEDMWLKATFAGKSICICDLGREFS